MQSISNNIKGCIQNNKKLLDIYKQGKIVVVNNSNSSIGGYFKSGENKVHLNIASVSDHGMINCNDAIGIIEHELIHMICFQKPLIVYSKVSEILFTFYKEFWKNFVKPEYIEAVASANLKSAILTDETDNSSKISPLSYQICNQFFSFLTKHKNIFLDESSLQSILNALNFLLGRKYVPETKVYNAMKDAYIKIYGDYNKFALYYQEILYASEILSISTQIDTPQAHKVTEEILQLL